MFSKDLPCEAVHLEKQRHAYLEVEEGLWIVMVIFWTVEKWEARIFLLKLTMIFSGSKQSNVCR